MKKILLLVFVLGIFANAGTADAYVTTDQHAISFGGTSALFLIEFAFGHENHDIHIPVLAHEGGTATGSAISYDILDDEDQRAKGSAGGLVLSSAPYRDGMYVIPKGESAAFTLFLIFTPDTSETDNEFRAQVTHLPFSFDGTQMLKLNPSELESYVTPSVELLPSVTVESVDVTYTTNGSQQSSLSSNRVEVNIHQTDD